jgi:hypothetical protein
MHDDFRLSFGESIAILSVSSHYDIEKIRVIPEIMSHCPCIDLVEKIILAKKYNIPDWPAPAYTALCQRAYLLQEWEAKRLGIRVAVKLAWVCEAVREVSLRSPLLNLWILETLFLRDNWSRCSLLRVTNLTAHSM